MKRRPDPYLRTMPWKAQAVFHPLERVLHRIEADGTVEAAGRTIVFHEDSKGGWYDLVAALRGIIQFHEIAAARHNLPIDLQPLVRFANKLDAGSPLFEDDLDMVRACIGQCIKQALNLRISQATDIVNTVRISMEFDKIKEAA